MKLGPQVLFCSTLMLSGCREVMTVNLPPNFHGGVLISCGSGGKVDLSVDIDTGGLGTADACPKKPIRLQIIREGEQVKPLASDPPIWNETSDGQLSGVEFAVP